MDINTTATVGLKATLAITLIVCSAGVIGIRRDVGKVTANVNKNLNTITSQTKDTMNQAKNTMIQTQEAIKSVTKQIDELELKECLVEVKNSLANLSGVLSAVENKVNNLDADSLNLFLSSISGTLRCVSDTLNKLGSKVSPVMIGNVIDLTSSFLKNPNVQNSIAAAAANYCSEYSSIDALLGRIQDIQNKNKGKSKLDGDTTKELQKATNELAGLLAEVARQDRQKRASKS